MTLASIAFLCLSYNILVTFGNGNQIVAIAYRFSRVVVRDRIRPHGFLREIVVVPLLKKVVSIFKSSSHYFVSEVILKRATFGGHRNSQVPVSP